MDFECGNIVRELIPFIEGELAPGEALEVRRHMKVCSSCWRSGVRISRVVSALLAGESARPPDGLAARTLVRAGAELR